MKCILVEDSNVADEIKEFIAGEIVQKDIRLKDIYNNLKKFNYKYIACMNDEKCVGVLPFILYKNDIANVINSMPFIGYGGISVKDNNEEIFKAIINFLEDYAAKNNVLLTTICTEPFDNDKDELYRKYFKYDFERKNFYQYIDLEKDIFDEMKAKFRGNLKRNIRKCKEKYNVSLVESYDLNDLSYWYENVYLTRLTETGCAIYPYEVFETLIKMHEKGRVKMIYGVKDDKIVAGGLYLKQKYSVDNFMRVVSTEYLHTQIGTYLDYFSIEYAIQNNMDYYNWQSCDEIGSSIFKYKEDWGSKIGYHFYLTKITGNISKLRSTSLDIVKKEFKGIYVMPYEEFKE